VNLVETSDLLTFVARVDNRNADDATVVAWHSMLAEFTLPDAMAACRRHFTTSDEYLKPFHVVRLIAELQRDRRRTEREQREHLEADRLAVGRGPVEDRSADITALVHALAEKMTPEQKLARAQLRANRERGRPVPPKSKKPKKRAPGDWPPPQTDDIAALATRYLIDGHDPAAVSERFAISRGWCRRAAKRFRTTNPEGTE
jgi:hypothetical protein